MERAIELIDQDQTAEARKVLDDLDMARLNQHERAMIYRLKAFVAYTAGDAGAAVQAFHASIDEEILPIQDETRMRFNIGQLHASQQEWKESLAALEEWVRWEVEPDPLGYYLMAIDHFQLEEIDAAIADAETAIDMSAEPKEGWLQLLAALFVQKEDYASTAPVLEELVLRYPKQRYWVQLSLIYGAKEEYKRSLAVQQVAYAQGLLVEDAELRRLARSYLHAELP
jgi:tetratricopeptide (TPR) repeat protein